MGGPFGATIGRALGALAGSVVDANLFAPRPQVANRAGVDIRLQGSSQGVPIPRLYGWGRLSGNIIWGTELERVPGDSRGGKGFGASAPEEPDEIVANFAVALCEGEVARLGRIWADGQLLETEGLTLRFYAGSEDQAPDGLIAAVQGEDNAPAYRGLCYLVFERLPLSGFGYRIPQISVELCRVVGALETQVQAVTVIPGSTEFGYDPRPRVRLLGGGRTKPENTHMSRQLSDWTLSLDELQALYPNLKHVALVVAWFGDDLRCGQCSVAPRVESRDKAVRRVEWEVAGLERDEARPVSWHEGGPAYGGTPSDAAMIAAIEDLRARGLSVALYPLLMMDIAADNGLPNPYGGTGQPAYPWRGRITCDPAPGVAGTPETSDAVRAQVSAFVGGTASWGYRRFVRHYAQLCAEAGGVDAFLIGSELRGLTGLRAAGNAFPFVEALVALAGEVRGLLGPGTKISYAADWSEYHGLQPADGPGDKLFNLDPLWASPDIDAIGIDNYMPVTDWRDGQDHADAQIGGAPYGTAYIGAGVARGEGYDWYYASDADRANGVRSTISDGAHGEPWVYRYKDLVGWWSNPHHNRIGGVRQASPTAFVPQGKPIWFTELGCGAVDKGGNGPNAFVDPKSAENTRPVFSNGTPDGLAQRQVLRAHLGHWTPGGAGFDEANNPVSAVYGGRMLDPERIYLWTWDARPFPAFPAQTEVWSDGPNHATGHWLTGRSGVMASDEMARAIAADYGLVLAQVEPVQPLIEGLTIEGLVSARDGLGPLLEVSGLMIKATPEGLALIRPRAQDAAPLDPDILVRDTGPVLSRRRPDPGEAVGRLALSFAERRRDYLTGTVTALAASEGGHAAASTPLVLENANGRRAAAQMLAERGQGGESMEFSLPPSQLALEVGDVIALAGEAQGPLLITETRDAGVRRIKAQCLAPPQPFAFLPDASVAAQGAPAAAAAPELFFGHVPAPGGGTRLLVGALARPWPGDVLVLDEDSGTVLARIGAMAAIGALTAPLAAAPDGVWDESGTLEVQLFAGHLASVSDGAALAGSNRLAVEKDDCSIEIIGFAQAELVGAGSYRLTRLLRGAAGTDHALGPAAAGRRVLVLGGTVAETAVPTARLGTALNLTIYAGAGDVEGTEASVVLDPAPALPLSPQDLVATRPGPGDDVVLSWARRSRVDTTGWASPAPPLDHAPETYAVVIVGTGGPVRTLTAHSQSLVYTAAQQMADFGAVPTSFDFTVAQVSQVYGTGPARLGAFNA